MHSYNVTHRDRTDYNQRRKYGNFGFHENVHNNQIELYAREARKENSSTKELQREMCDQA